MDVSMAEDDSRSEEQTRRFVDGSSDRRQWERKERNGVYVFPCSLKRSVGRKLSLYEKCCIHPSTRSTHNTNASQRVRQLLFELSRVVGFARQPSVRGGSQIMHQWEKDKETLTTWKTEGKATTCMH
jgi:hypothetical protein